MPTESSYPPVKIPNVGIWDFLFERRDREYPDNKSLYPSLLTYQLADNSLVIYRDADTNRFYTYSNVKKTAIDFGTGLKAVWDWKKGDVLTLFTPNCVDTPAVIWGCHWAGGILSPANPGYTAHELAFQLKDAGSKALVTQLAFLSTAREAAREAGIPEDKIILMGDERDKSMKFKHFLSIKNPAATARYRKSKVDPQVDLAFLVYSSGTTGCPKGVMLSHENIIANILMAVTLENGNLTWNGGKHGKGDNLIAFLPFFHIYGASLIERLEYLTNA